MADLESELKLKNWLSIVTFDIFKYAVVGGQVRIEQDSDGLAITLVGVDMDTEGVNAKFIRYLQALATEPEKETG